MKTTTLALTLIGLALTSGLPAFAATTTDGINAQVLMQDGAVDRRKPRIPGGSGCDDPRDLIEHPECGG